MAKIVSQQLDELQARVEYLVNRPVVKSIQVVSGRPYTNSSVTTYCDYTLNVPVNTVKSVVVLNTTASVSTNGGSSTTVSTAYWYCTATLVNSSTLRFTGNTQTGITYTATVIEFM